LDNFGTLEIGGTFGELENPKSKPDYSAQAKQNE
jgi:hypothetical protein